MVNTGRNRVHDPWCVAFATSEPFTKLQGEQHRLKVTL